MPKLKKALLAVVGAIVAIFVLLSIYVLFQPSEYVVQREISINAPAEKIFPHLNNQRVAESWGPWLEVDPKAVMAYSGPDAGVGAKASWKSPGQLGHGSATIVESVPNELVRIKLEYTQPMTMTQTSDYIVRSAGEQSVVTWKVTGENSFIGRFMCLFFDMDKMVGGMFEKGLSNLKRVVETGAK